MATRTTSASFYIAKAIESIQKIENLRYEINAMGTILESDNMDVINTATKQMMETVHNLGIARVEVIIKIDSRRDKQVKMEEKLDSIKKHFDAQELAFPRKPAPVRGRLGAISKAVINAFAKNKEVTQAELATEIRPLVKSEKNATDYSNQYYKMMYAASHGMTSNQVLTALSPDSAKDAPEQDEVSGE